MDFFVHIVDNYVRQAAIFAHLYVQALLPTCFATLWVPCSRYSHLNIYTDVYMLSDRSGIQIL